MQRTKTLTIPTAAQRTKSFAGLFKGRRVQGQRPWSCPITKSFGFCCWVRNGRPACRADALEQAHGDQICRFGTALAVALRVESEPAHVFRTIRWEQAGARILRCTGN